MSKDFRATQIQTQQIISSGSLAGGTGAKLVIYPIESQGTPVNTGVINQSVFNTSSLNGRDIFLFVSGGIGQKGTTNRSISVFGGDLHISGNITIDGTVIGPSAQWIDGTPSPRLRTTASVAIGAGAVFAENIGSDVYFYVSGTANNLGYTGATGAKTAVFGGDVFVSGNMIVGAGNSIATNIVTNSNYIFGGSGNTILSGAYLGSIYSSITSIISHSLGGVIVGGFSNAIRYGGGGNSLNGVFAGLGNTINEIGTGNVAVGGSGNTITDSTLSAILAGDTLQIVNTSTRSVVLGGVDSLISNGIKSAIAGGTSNNISESDDCFIGGGSYNVLLSGESSDRSINNAIIGGDSNNIFGLAYSFIGSSTSGRISSVLRGTILGSNDSQIYNSSNSSIISSNTSIISGSSIDAGNVILGGRSNFISNSNYSSIIGGISNQIARYSSSSFTFGTHRGTVLGTDQGGIIGGTDSFITRSVNAIIINGYGNLIDNRTRATIIGSNLTSSGDNSILLGGSFGGIGYSVTVSASQGFTIATGSMVVRRGIVYNPRIVTANYTITNDDYILASSASSPITMSLPTSPTTGSTYIVKEIRGLTTNLIVSSSNYLIDGSATYNMPLAYSSAQFIYFGSGIWGVL